MVPSASFGTYNLYREGLEPLEIPGQMSLGASPLCVLPSSLQLWRVVIDSLVSHSLWLRVLLGLPEKETVYLEAMEEPGQLLCSHSPAPYPMMPRDLSQGYSWARSSAPAPLPSAARIWEKLP